MAPPRVPPLFAHALRYAAGDNVRSPFGSGVVVRSSDSRAHVEVRLAFGATLFATRESLMPEFRMLECGEIPRGTRVLVRGSSEAPTGARKHELRLAPGARVRTKLGLGIVTAYRQESDSYAVQLDFGGVGYLVPASVACVDLRLLEKLPQPLSADAIFQQFDGRVSRADAAALSAKAHATYARVQRFCEQHAETISFLSTNATYGDQYSQALGALFDPALADATLRVRAAGAGELEKLKKLAATARTTLESELLDGQDASAFFAQAATVLGQLKGSREVRDLQQRLRGARACGASPQGQRLELAHVLQALEAKVSAQQPALDRLLQSELLTTLQQRESDVQRAQDTIAHLEKLASAKMGVASLTELAPSELLARAEQLLPRVSARAGALVESTEKYLAQMQQTTQGQTLLRKAKQLVRSVDDPDAFCEHVTRAIADVKFDALAEWGAGLAQNRAKRQAFVNQVKDHCLDFFMSVLPTIQVDTIAGVEEGVEYALSRLDLSSFRVRKERVKVRMGTVADEALFTVRATHLTALLQGFQWTFAQKHFPYLNGGGLADAELAGGVIALGFKAEKIVVDAATGACRPTLVLHSIEVEIQQELKIVVQGSWFSAVYNVLATVFAALIREYLAKSMETKLLGHMIKLLHTLNAHMDEYWPLVLQLLDIRVEDLPPASPWRGARELELQPNQVECSFAQRESVPFAFAKAVLNKHVVVSRVLDPAAAGALDSELQRVPVGASVVAINGLACHKLTLDEFKALLETTLPVPFTLRFSLAPEDMALNRLQRVVPRPPTATVVFKQEGPFGFRLRSRPLAPFGAIVVGFTEPGADGRRSPAELSGKIAPGQVLTRVNDTDLRFKTLREILQVLKETTRRPATLHFAPSPDGVVTLRDWPPMVELEPSDEDAADGRNYCVLSAFVRVPSFAQKSRAVQRGDVLVRVNDTSMVAPSHAPGFAAIMATLKRISDETTPMRALFVTREQYDEMRATRDATATATDTKLTARASPEIDTTAPKADDEVDGGQQQSRGDWEADYLASIETREVVFPKAPLGILFGNLKDEAVFIRQFISSPGAAEKCGLLQLGQAVLQICGKTVPADATPAVVEQMIADVATRAKPPATYSITVRDLDLERELMK
ncbi:hypothetical protein PybrP1_011407 [[Pythium] brassicae (nom. inval.)]|nr:hypothetical protein PybrP1_011407 [[Pythium] brassicae (nom. inval.)]